MSGHSFDVGSVLGIGAADSSPLPEAADGEIVLRVAEGISFIGLRDSPVGQRLMHQQDWYEQYEWCRQVFPAGRYRLQVSASESDQKTYSEQQALLKEGEQVAPVTLVAVALLCMQRSGHPDPLLKAWTRCSEPTDSGCHVTLTWDGGRLDVNDCWDDFCDSAVRMSALRTC